MPVKKIVSIGFTVFLLSACSSVDKARYPDQPPGALGRWYQNTVTRFNGYYNADLAFDKSMAGGKQGFREDFYQILPLSVADAVASDGSMSGEMDGIITKTANTIDRHPFTKWIDDNYLLNGIAHYIQGDLPMAEEIFIYTSSEFKDGVNFDRIGEGRRYRPLSPAKLRKQQFKEKQKAKREEAAKQIQSQQDRKKAAREKARERKKNSYEKTKKLSKKEQFKLKQQSEAKGEDKTVEELIKDYQKSVEDQKLKNKDEKTRKEAKEKIRKSKTFVNKNRRSDGFFSFLRHKLAGKDAILWLAKTYIAQDEFVAAQAVLTTINEDENFPARLDQAFYLTNAQMHYRLDNNPKVIEYIELAIGSTKKRKEKARLFFVLGQLYQEMGKAEESIAAFERVKKFRPTYNMEYHARRNVIRQKIETGEYSYSDLTKELRRMVRDEKNEEFLDEIYYDLGNAYAAQNKGEDALEAFELSIENNKGNDKLATETYIALGDYAYSAGNYSKAGPSFTSANAKIAPDHERLREVKLKAEALGIINSGLETIHKQDSLLALGALPQEEIEALVKKKVNNELKAKRRAQLEKAGNMGRSGFSGVQQPGTQRSSNKKDKKNGQGEWYFYDVNQSVTGFSSFKQRWGDRPLSDHWRRSDVIKRRVARNQGAKNNTGTDKNDDGDLFSKYLNEIPISESDRVAAHQEIENNYLEVGKAFVDLLADYPEGIKYLDILLKKYPEGTTREQALYYAIKAYQLDGRGEEASAYVNEFTKLSAKTDFAKRVQKYSGLSASSGNSVQTLYERTFDAFEAEHWSEVVKNVKEAESFVDNPFKDRFAYLNAIAVGKMGEDSILKENLQKFINEYPGSPLVSGARAIIAGIK